MANGKDQTEPSIQGRGSQRVLFAHPAVANTFEFLKFASDAKNAFDIAILILKYAQVTCRISISRLCSDMHGLVLILFLSFFLSFICFGDCWPSTLSPDVAFLKEQVRGGSALGGQKR